MRGSVYRRGSTWTWQFTTGSRAHGTRRPHSRGGYPTEEAARAALDVALIAVGSPPPRVAPVAVDNSSATLVGLVDSGACTSVCLLGAVEEDACVCRCGGEFHGIAREGLDGRSDVRAQLRGLRREAETRQERQAAAVMSARGDGMEWAEIADLIGMNPDVLSRRYGRPRPGGVATHCPNGHEYPEGVRTCPACKTAAAARERARRRR